MECEPLDLSTSPSSGAARPSSGDETFGGLSFSSSAIGCGGRRGGGSLTPQSYTRAADATTLREAFSSILSTQLRKFLAYRRPCSHRCRRPNTLRRPHRIQRSTR